ncbi:MAG TPA: sialate O-acetylesterase [Tepidisphaeraceae bacterium]|jgi:sialate O-acetylesterase|nr:sialate O-acetylesterase [Tepidisphaeraceae bacterium]
MWKFWILSVSLLVCAGVRADVKLPSIFGDHMVVQRGMKIPVWGSADVGEKVTVKVLSQEQSATADDKGKWRIMLDPVASDGPVEITVSGKNSITIQDVLVGEVWLCSGQSNMEFHLDKSSNKQEALAAADRPKMRLFIVKRSSSDMPLDDCSGQWKICNADTAQSFSAVGYFFGVQLQEKLNVPMGLIESNWGGTRAEAWTSKEDISRLSLPYEPQTSEQYLHPAQNPATRPVAAAKQQLPAAIYNAMIHPIIGYAMRGVIWYQGESNAVHAAQYHDVLAAMITGWRHAWGEGDFPFLIVQLANFSVPPNAGIEVNPAEGWPEVREAQAQMVRDLPNVGLALAIDIGNSKDIHPRNKAEVGRRLALAADKVAYGQDVVYAGPTFKSLRIDGNKAIVSFDHADGGLVAKGDTLTGFEIAGDDGKFVPAKAAIEGDTISVTADSVAAPKAVRYGWADDPKCDLYNKSDLPAVPFRTAH